MTTPARRHYMKVTAAEAAGGSEGDMQGEAYEQHLMMLHRDKAELHTIRSIKDKIARKAEMLPHYQSYLQGVLENGQGASDQVLVTLLLWTLDVGDIAAALPIAEYAIRYGLAAPDAHQRTNAEILVEEAVTVLMDGDDNIDADSLPLLEEIARIVEGRDIVDPVHAKLHKAMGRACEAGGHDQDAHDHYAKALALHDKCGCKRLRNELERRMKKNSDQPSG